MQAILSLWLPLTRPWQLPVQAHPSLLQSLDHSGLPVGSKIVSLLNLHFFAAHETLDSLISLDDANKVTLDNMAPSTQSEDVIMCSHAHGSEPYDTGDHGLDVVKKIVATAQTSDTEFVVKLAAPLDLYVRNAFANPTEASPLHSTSAVFSESRSRVSISPGSRVTPYSHPGTLPAPANLPDRSSLFAPFLPRAILIIPAGLPRQLILSHFRHQPIFSTDPRISRPFHPRTILIIPAGLPRQLIL